MSDRRIVQTVPRGQHIIVECDECGCQYSTKNIPPIGIRSLFPINGDCEHSQQKLKPIEE